MYDITNVVCSRPLWASSIEKSFFMSVKIPAKMAEKRISISMYGGWWLQNFNAVNLTHAFLKVKLYFVSYWAWTKKQISFEINAFIDRWVCSWGARICVRDKTIGLFIIRCTLNKCLDIGLASSIVFACTLSTGEGNYEIEFIISMVTNWQLIKLTFHSVFFSVPLQPT